MVSGEPLWKMMHNGFGLRGGLERAAMELKRGATHSMSGLAAVSGHPMSCHAAVNGYSMSGQAAGATVTL
jgi:hypothetical protein